MIETQLTNSLLSFFTPNARVLANKVYTSGSMEGNHHFSLITNLDGSESLK